MFKIEDEFFIYATRGDTVSFYVEAENDGVPYTFEPGDVLRMKVFEKKACENVVLQKDFTVEEATTRVNILLTEADTRIGDIISKPKDYWYEIELNPLTNPQTIVAYDEDGPKVLRLYPEGNDTEVVGGGEAGSEKPYWYVDEDFSATSQQPIQNQAITRAFLRLEGMVEDMDQRLTAADAKEFADRVQDIARVEKGLEVEKARIDNLSTLHEGSTTGDAELMDIRVGADGVTYASAGTSVRSQMDGKVDKVGNVAPKAATANLLLIDHYRNGHYYSGETGELVEKANAGYYPMIRVEPNTLYTNCRCQILCIYDENKEFIESDTAYSARKTFTTPEDAAYITVSGNLDNFGKEGLYLGEYTGAYVEGEKLFSIGQVEGLKEKVDSIVAKSVGKNLFNRYSDTLVRGKYIMYLDGTEGVNNNYCYDILPAEGGQSYTVSTGQNEHIAFFAEDGGFISGLTTSGGITFTAPDGTKRMSVSVRQQYLDTFQVEKGTVRTEYERYQEGVAGKDILDGTITQEKLSPAIQQYFGLREVHVGPNEEYTSILKALKDFNGRPVTVYVHSGEYNIYNEYIAEYGADYFTNYAGYNTDDVFDRGLNLCDGTSLIGVGAVILAFHYAGDNEAVKKRFAPLNPTQNNRIENIQMSIDGCRYGIHDDFATDEGTTEIRNCYFTGVSELNTFIGGGFGMKNTYIIESCVFENAGGINIAYHNNVNAGARNTLIVKDCSCEGNIRGGMYGASTEESLMLVSGCRANNISCILTDETGTYQNENIKLVAWNNDTGEGGGITTEGTATVGQVLKVAAVDENGKVTAVAAEDMQQIPNGMEMKF